tara:strand:- start:2370 stop:2930 length:561 start_codon:yes stop_codon:yes gene_type:complete
MKKKLKIIGAIIGSIILALGVYIAYNIFFPVSPKSTINHSSGFSDFEVVYSRPYKNDRLIFGDESSGALVPFGKYWRTGANAATTFETSSDIIFNDKELKAGKYTLYTVPGKEVWKVVLNHESDRYFARFEPDYSKDVLETFVYAREFSTQYAYEQLSIGFENLDNSLVLTIIWDTIRISIPIMKQ